MVATADTRLGRCVEPVANVAVEIGEEAEWLDGLREAYQLPDPMPVLSLLMQNSGCFRVVDRSRILAIARERAALEEAGVQFDDSASAQVATVDYIITPKILIQDPDASGGGGILGGITSRLTGGLVVVGVRNAEARTMLTLTNARSGVQEAVVEGSARNRDIGIGGFGVAGLSGGASLGGAGAYTSTDMGKIVMAAMLDAYNNILRQMNAPVQWPDPPSPNG